MRKAMQQQGNTVVIALITVVGVLLFGIIGLAALGRDLGQVAYVIGPTLAILVGIIGTLAKVDKVAKETSEQSDKLDEIHKQTNGNLDKKFKLLHERLDALGAPNIVNIKDKGNGTAG